MYLKDFFKERVPKGEIFLEHALFDLINAQTLAHMKPDALIINVSRGSLIDEPALIQALKEQRLAGAG